MKALVKKHRREGLWLEEIPEPSVRECDVLIRVRKTSICGTDVHIFKWDEWAQKTIPVPMPIGHEFMGEVAAVGGDVDGLQIGQRVSGEGHLFCGHCRSCRAGVHHLCINTRGVGVNRPGCFAEYIAIPASNVFPLPAGVSDEEASILDPLGNAVHSALCFDLVGEDVLVTGAGPIGIMAAAVARRVGARNVVITDINPYRLELARKMGTGHAFNVRESTLPQIMEELHMQEGFDVGLEMSGSPEALVSMIEGMRAGGKLALLGIIPAGAGIPWDKVIFKALTLKGIYGRQIFETWYKMCALIESGLRLDPIFTHRYHFSEFEKGFEAMSSGNSGKVLLDWTEG